MQWAEKDIAFSGELANNRNVDRPRPVVMRGSARARSSRRAVGRHMGRIPAGIGRNFSRIDSRGGIELRNMPEATISLDSHDEELAVFGSRDQYLRQIRDALGVKVLARHGELRVEGEPERVAQARQVFEELR